MTPEQFKELIGQKDIHLDDNQMNQFYRYFELIYEYNKVMNLTGIDDLSGVYEKHFYDSLLFGNIEEFKNINGQLIDIGSGAGFPGICIAIAFPNLKVTLLEPLTKRYNFLNIVKDALRLNNVEIINERAEDLVESKRSYYDLATARAVSKLPILLELTLPLIKVNGLFIAMKGKQAKEEIEESKNALHLLNGKIIKIEEDTLIENLDQRANIFITKTREHSNQYPRSYSQIKKKPL